MEAAWNNKFWLGEDSINCVYVRYAATELSLCYIDTDLQYLKKTLTTHNLHGKTLELLK
jgi:hypothetical protein